MLIISGTAECTTKNDKYNQGDRHIITVFSPNEILDENLSLIETYLNDLGWDDILIEETQLILNSNELEHSVLKEGFEKALEQGLSVVINNEPLVNAA